MKRDGAKSINFVTDQKKKIRAVIVPWDRYIQLIEDIHDAKVVFERKDEKLINMEEVKKDLNV